MAGARRDGEREGHEKQDAAGAPSLALAELLASRLCHDLAGAVGTLAGALELAGSEPATVADALLIGGEVASAMAERLRLWRAAWAADAAEPLDGVGLRRLCRGLPERVRLDADDLDPGWHWPSGPARVLLNALLLGAESLPAGGVLTLASAGAGALLLVPEGPRAAWPAGFAGFLTDTRAAWRAVATATPRRVQAPLTVLVAEKEDVGLGFALAGAPEAAPPLMLRRR